MKVLALIPARGGSKGLPGKNMRQCGGKPLLAWSVLAAQASRLVTEVVVSSDSPAILLASECLGAGTIVRPPELATDVAMTDPVLVHAAGLHPCDLIVLLQPTVPVRRPGLIDHCIERLLATGADSLLTAYPLHFVWWREDEYLEAAGPDKSAWRSQCQRRPRRQDMTSRELMYHEDGSVFVTRADILMATGNRLAGRVEVVETVPTVDIDTEADLFLADAMLRAAMVREEATA